MRVFTVVINQVYIVVRSFPTNFYTIRIIFPSPAESNYKRFSSSHLADWGATIMFYIQSMVHVIFSSFTVEEGKKTVH